MNTETRPASFDEALREIETGSTPMDGGVMTATLGDLNMRYARSVSDYKVLRGYAVQLNAQCDAQTKRIEELESELAHADVVLDGDPAVTVDTKRRKKPADGFSDAAI